MNERHLQYWLDRLADPERFAAAADETAEREALSLIGDEPLVCLLRGAALSEKPWDRQREEILSGVLGQVLAGAIAARTRALPLDESSVAAVTFLYDRLPSESTARGRLLQWLAERGGTTAWTAWRDSIAHDPPRQTDAAVLAMAPLFQRHDWPPALIFPGLLTGLAFPVVAGAILDLANHVVRTGLSSEHPAAARAVQLDALLRQLSERLQEVQEGCLRPVAGDDVQQVNDQVCLAVSLCDALALIGANAARGTLRAVLKLRHRRLRTEAAAALARLGDEEGRRALLDLVREPTARLRVLQYADELGLADEIDAEYATDAARGEAELALWLSQPAQFGFAPHRLRLIEQRTLYWPGFDELVEAYLIRFEYDFGDEQYAGIGVAGPLTHAFAADLGDLPPDDIFAAFAGWQACHEEIVEFDPTDFPARLRPELIRRERQLRDCGFVQSEALLVGSFLGDCVLVTRSCRDGQSGIAVTDDRDTLWLAARGSRPITAHEAYCLYKGRRLLRAFN